MEYCVYCDDAFLERIMKKLLDEIGKTYYWSEWVREWSLMPHPTQYRSFRRWSSQPITWLILTKNEHRKIDVQKLNTNTIQENKHTKTKYKSNKVNNLIYRYPGSVASYDTRPGNKVGLFYDGPKPTRAGTFYWSTLPNSEKIKMKNLTFVSLSAAWYWHAVCCKFCMKFVCSEALVFL